MTPPPAPFLAVDAKGRRLVLHPVPDGSGGVELRTTFGQLVGPGEYRLPEPANRVKGDDGCGTPRRQAGVPSA